MGRRKNESLLEIAFTSAWPVSASFAAVVLFLGYVVFPVMTRANIILNTMAQSVKPIVLIIAGMFALISLVKWFTASRRPSEAVRVDLPRQRGRQRPQRTWPAAGTNVSAQRVSSIRREPVIPVGARLQAITEWSLELIQSIEWKRFEDLCQKFYEAKGIRSECTPLGPDGGIDIRLFQDDSGLATAIVQCKAWGDSYVGVKPIRELLGVMVHQKVGKAFFMTSGKYSDDAREFAAPNKITLLDGALLLAMFKRLPNDECQKLLAFATEGDYNIPSCPTCGTKMRLIVGKEGKRDFWGCTNFPKCRQKLWARRGAADLPTAMYP